MPRTDRSLAGAHDALRQTPRRRRAPARPTWSLPVATVARWAVALIVARAMRGVKGAATRVDELRTRRDAARSAAG